MQQFIEHLKLFFSGHKVIEFIGYTFIDDSGISNLIDNVFSIKCAGLWLNFHTLDCQTLWSVSNSHAEQYSDLEERYESQISQKVLETYKHEAPLEIEIVFEKTLFEIKGLKIFNQHFSIFICFMDYLLRFVPHAGNTRADLQVLQHATHFSADELSMYTI